MIATDRERQRQVVAIHLHQRKRPRQWNKPKHREGDHVQYGSTLVEAVIVNIQTPFIYGIELVTDRGVMLWANERELY